MAAGSRRVRAAHTTQRPTNVPRMFAILSPGSATLVPHFGVQCFVQWLHIVLLKLCNHCIIFYFRGCMASLKASLSNCKIYIYPGDHNPPHFHLRGPDSRALVEIVTLKVIAGKASRKDLEEVREMGSQRRKPDAAGIGVEKAQ